METQDQKNILAPVNHGVHLCHKCGWPFPNPHPSARHRRAHKRACGKIEGYTLIDSEASNHSTCSDDEHVSDDENKNPSPKMAEMSKTEKGIDKLEEKFKKSEDDAFGDAVAEFSDGKLVGNSKNSASIGKMDESNSSRSFRNCEISDLAQLPRTSMDESLFHSPEIAPGTVDQGAGAEDTPSLQSINILTDINIDQKKGSMGDLYPTESKLNDDIISGKDVICFEENVDSDSNVMVEAIQPKLKIEETIEGASEDSHSNRAIRTIQQEMKIEEMIERALDPSAFDAQTEILSEVAVKCGSSDDLLEDKDGEGQAEEHNSNVDVLILPEDLNISGHSKTLAKDFKDDSGVKLEQPGSTDSIAGMEIGKDKLTARNEGSKQEIPVQGEVNESFVSDTDNNPKEEQVFEDVPKDSFPLDCTNNVSEVISAIEDALGKGLNPIHKSDTADSSMEERKETPQTKIEEIKGHGEEHLLMAAESNDMLQAVLDNDDGSDRELRKTDKKYTDSVEDENSKQNLGLACNESMENENLKQAEEEAANSEPFLPVEGNDNVVKPHVNASLMDVSADSSSQTDSVEGNWGSALSVFSTRSDVQAVVENQVVPATDNQAIAGEKNGWKSSKASSRSSDKSEAFEPPSFMTLVEPGRAGGHNLADSDIQTVQTTKPTMLQSGWLPACTHVSSDSEGRKKNEEIIAKVSNWNTGKEQHIPLKSLLGEAAMEGRPKSPKPENPPSSLRKDEKMANNKGETIDSVPSRDSPAAGQLAKKTGKVEWDYPAGIKREKKKVKGRSYWAQLVCCTSANY